MGKITKVALPIAGLAALVVVMLWMSGALDGSKTEPGVEPARASLPAPASTQVVDESQLSAWYEGVGTVRSRVVATVAPQITGSVLTVSVEVGDSVEEGDVLITLDSQEYQARLEQAKSGLVGAQAGQEQAAAAFERVQRLFDQKAATPEQLEDADARKKQADAAVVTAEQKVREAQTYLGYTTITSPLKGVVADRTADPGDLAYPGKPLLVLQNPDDLRLEAYVREGLIGRVRRQKESAEEVDVELTALGRVVQGTISEIVPSADPVSRSFQVRVTLPSTEGLYPGMFGKLRVPLDARPSLLVPRAAIQRVGQLPTVRVKEDERWARRFVSLGAVHGEKVEVLSGLRGGEVIGLD